MVCDSSQLSYSANILHHLAKHWLLNIIVFLYYTIIDPLLKPHLIPGVKKKEIKANLTSFRGCHLVPWYSAAKMVTDTHMHGCDSTHNIHGDMLAPRDLLLATNKTDREPAMSAPRSTFFDSRRGHSTQPYSTIPLPYRELGRGGAQSQQSRPDELTKAASPDPCCLPVVPLSLRSESHGCSIPGPSSPDVHKITKTAGMGRCHSHQT